MESIVEVVDAKRIFKIGDLEVRALNGVNMKIKEGEFMSIMGPSGSGKSTLLNLIGALDKPTEGKVLIRGTDISKLNDDELAELRNREIGFVFQFFNLIPRMTALKNVELPMSFASVSSTQRKKRATKVLEMVGLGDRLEHKPTELSGGQQQRVAIARALVNDPAIVLCDEPTGNIDTKTGAEIMNILKRLNDEERKSFIIVTHDPNIANSTHRIMNMQDGIITKDQNMMNMEDGIITKKDKSKEK